MRSYTTEPSQHIVTSFGIDKRYIGYHHHLDVDSITLHASVKDLPKEKLVMGSAYFREVFCPLFGMRTPVFPSEPFYTAMKKVAGGSFRPHQTPWQHTMPLEAYRNDLRRVVEWGRANLLGVDLDYLKTVLEPTNAVFEALEGAPCVGGNVLRYERVSTATGRMTAVNICDEDGFNILRYPKNERHLLESRYGANGKLVFLDYSSVEPSVLFTLLEMGVFRNVSPPNPYKQQQETRDIYGYVQRLVTERVGEIDRSVLKRCVVSILYGATRETVIEQLRNTVQANVVYDTVYEVFRLNALRQVFVDEARSNQGKFIVNYYGRRLDLQDVADYKLTNRFVQSTAADVTMLGFLNIVRELQSGKNALYQRIHPAWLLHDAFVVDVHNNSLKALPALCKVGTTNILGFSNTTPFLKLKLGWFNKPLFKE